MYHSDLRLGEVVYTLVFDIISFSWLLSLNGFKFIFYGVTVKTIYTWYDSVLLGVRQQLRTLASGSTPDALPIAPYVVVKTTLFKSSKLSVVWFYFVSIFYIVDVMS